MGLRGMTSMRMPDCVQLVVVGGLRLWRFLSFLV